MSCPFIAHLNGFNTNMFVWLTRWHRLLGVYWVMGDENDIVGTCPCDDGHIALVSMCHLHILQSSALCERRQRDMDISTITFEEHVAVGFRVEGDEDYLTNMTVLAKRAEEEGTTTLRHLAWYISQHVKSSTGTFKMPRAEENRKELIARLMNCSDKTPVWLWLMRIVIVYLVPHPRSLVPVEAIQDIADILHVFQPTGSPNIKLLNGIATMTDGVSMDFLRRVTYYVAACITTCPYMIDDGICWNVNKSFRKLGRRKNCMLPFSADIVAAAPSDIPTICKVAEELGFRRRKRKVVHVPRDVEQVVEQHLASILGDVAISLISLADADDDKGVVVPSHESLVCGVISVLADECHVRSLRV
jgi:hypothetical protein